MSDLTTGNVLEIGTSAEKPGKVLCFEYLPDENSDKHALNQKRVIAKFDKSPNSLEKRLYISPGQKNYHYGKWSHAEIVRLAEGEEEMEF